jgi:anti-sigma factor RsiW
MKDSRFIELLNLYIDRQITAAETAELEAEIQSHPKRQATYRQYCQIHSATKVVYESFRAVAAEQPAVGSGAKGVVERFETRRQRPTWTYYAGGAAVAACLALVFMRQGPESPAAAPILAEATQPKAIVTEVPVAPVTIAKTSEPGLVSLRNTVAVSPDYSATLAALREQDEERAFYNERLQAGRAPSLFSDDMFESKRTLGGQNPRVFRSQPAATTSQQQSEFAAFQFQR